MASEDHCLACTQWGPESARRAVVWRKTVLVQHRSDKTSGRQRHRHDVAVQGAAAGRASRRRLSRRLRDGTVELIPSDGPESAPR